MPKFDVLESIVVNAPKEQTMAVVADFKQWPAWSPWLSAEPDCPMNYDDDGKGYSWDGKIIGAGRLETIEHSDSRFDHQLTFLKPWKSQSQTYFEFKEVGEGTEVSWGMNGSMPFFMFFMTKMMKAWIGMDYRRGLSKLKDYVETGSVPSWIDYEGPTQVEGCHYIGIKKRCGIDEIGPDMEQAFGELTQWLSSSGQRPEGPMFCLYHKWDMVKSQAQYTAAIPLAAAPAELPEGFIAGQRPQTKTFAVKHTGNYKHLGNAWSGGMMRGQNKIFKASKKVPPFEMYMTDPRNTPENDNVTVIQFPMR